MTDRTYFLFAALAGIVFGLFLWAVDPNIMAVILGAGLSYAIVVVRLLSQNRHD